MNHKMIVSSENSLLKYSDLDHFDDTRVRLLAYYSAIWYSSKITSDADKFHLYELYCWLITEKPLINELVNSSRYEYIRYMLMTFKADDGDFMGELDLQDVKLAMKIFN